MGAVHERSLEFARAHADKDEDYWDSIIWSDDTKINVFGTDGFKTVWDGMKMSMTLH